MSAAKHDTRLLVAGGELVDELGQHSSSLVAVELGAHEPSSARTALDGHGSGRALEVLAELTTELGVLLDHREGAVLGYQLLVWVGAVWALVGEDLAGAVAIPGVAAEPDARHLVHWATEPNPASKGPEDELRSELLVWNEETDELASATFFHGHVEVSPAGGLSLGGVFTGGEWTQPWPHPIHAARIGARFHTSVEAREDWRGQSPPPALVGIERIEGRCAPIDAAELDELGGPVYQLAAARALDGSHRLVSPIAAAMPIDPPTLTANLAKVYPQRWIAADAEGWQRCLAFVWRRRPPLHCNYLRASVHAALWATQGAPAKLEVRACSSAIRPGAPGEPLVSRSSVTRTIDDGPDGPGAWLVFDAPHVRTLRAPDGSSWIWFEFRVAEGEPDALTRFRLPAWSWLPLLIEAQIMEGISP